jgi:acetylornithine deacetylase/succinyl-diaminopimelate desuccinylase-like protein
VDNLKAVASYVKEADTIEMVQNLIRIPSPTGKELDIANYVAEFMRKAGFDDVQMDEDWNVLGTVYSGNAGPTLLMLTHTDSGVPGNMENPFSGEIRSGLRFGKEGNVIFGRGAAAPKCAISSYLYAAQALIEWGRENWRGTLQVACVTKDLNANHDGIRELHKSIGLAPTYVIAGEPSDNQVVMGARGISHVQVTLKGIETHWGRPKEGVNPLYGLADILLEAEQESLPEHPVLGGATVSAISVSSDAEPPRTPHTASVVFDRRVLPEETIEGIIAEFNDIVEPVVKKRNGLSAEVSQIRGMYSFAAKEDTPLKQGLIKGGKAVTGRDIGTTFISFSSNAGYVIRELGVPGVAFAPGNIMDVGSNEHVEINKLIEGTKILAAGCVQILSDS